jgi:hypothetical protein
VLTRLAVLTKNLLTTLTIFGFVLPNDLQLSIAQLGIATHDRRATARSSKARMANLRRDSARRS